MKLRGSIFLILLSLVSLRSVVAIVPVELPVEAESNFYDYIIVGAGSAGSILARKLSDRNESVLVIDIGEFRYSDPIILDPNPLASQIVTNELLFGQRYAKVYPVPVGFLAALFYSEGQGSIGGGGAHNLLLAVRGTPDIYDGWAGVTGDPRWLYNSLLPKMIALETYTPNGTIANPAQRGFNGPIKVTQTTPVSQTPGPGGFYGNLAAITDTVFSSDYNDPTLPTPAANGVVMGANQVFVTPGVGSHRSYSALEFLPMAPSPNAVIDSNGNGLNGRDLKILTSARAIKIKFEGNRAIGVEYIRTFGRQDEIRTACLNDNGKLVLSAGSIQTPKLLLLSGVGPAAELNNLGIKVVLDSPNVGRNLQDQYGPNTLMLGSANQGEVFLDGNSPVSPITAVPLTPKIRRIQSIVGGGGGVVTALAALTNPKSRGSLTLASANPLIDPDLDFNLYSDGNFATPGTDANLAVRYLRIICNTAAASGFFLLKPTSAQCAGTDAGLFAYATETDNWVAQSHAVGTARMGTNIGNSVVDGRLKVHGLDNIYIGDNSVEPETVNGNTNFAAYYIALELANILGYPTPPAL